MMYLKYLFLVLISCTIAVNNFAQKNPADSLHNALKSTRHDTLRIKILFELANEYYLENPDTVLLICEHALSLSINEKYKKGMAEGYGWIGYLAQNKGDIPKALNFYHKSLKIKEEITADSRSIGDKMEIAVLYNNIAEIYKGQNELAKALDYYKMGLKLQEENGNKNLVASLLNNIGTIYDQEEDLTSGLEYYHKCLKIGVETGDKRVVANANNNIALIYIKQGKVSSSLTGREAYFNDALNLFQKGLEALEGINDKELISTAYNNIGGIYLEKKNYLLAEEYCMRSLELAKEIGYPKIIRNTTETLFKIHKMQQNGMLALKYHELFVQMKDSIKNDETKNILVKKQIQYEYDKREAIAQAQQDKKDALALEELEKQTMQRNGFIGGFALMFALAGVSYRNFRNKSKANDIISKQKEEVEIQKNLVEEKQREILDSIIYAKRIQNAIFPPSRMIKEYLPESFILYKPKDIVAGDFYWMEPQNGKVFFAAADCTGHGVPGALVSVICNNALNRSVREYGITEPGKILDKTREIVISEFEKSDDDVNDGMDISLCSLENNTLCWAGANNPLWIIRQNEIMEFKPDKQPVGKYAENCAFTTHTIDLQKGDAIYLFTDGYADQFGGDKGKKFKSASFKKLLFSIQKKTMKEQKVILSETFEQWKEDLEQVDDVCVIGLRI